MRALPVPVLAGIDAFGTRAVAAADLVAVFTAASGLVLGAPAAIDDPVFDAAVVAGERAVAQRWSSASAFAFVKASAFWYTHGPEAGTTHISIDVVDHGDDARLALLPEPTATIADPGGLIASWREVEATASALAAAGELAVGECRGGLHCATGFGHDSIRGGEDLFIAEAPRHAAGLCDVLRHDRDPRARAAAAFVLAYAGDVAAMVAALVPSIADPSHLVRNNVLRVLVVIQERAPTIVLPVAPILRALRFPTACDRNKAGSALVFLVTHEPERLRAQVLAEVGDTLVAMTASQPNNRVPAVAALTALAGRDLGSPAAWQAWLAPARAGVR